MRVGIAGQQYPERRAIIGAVEDAEYVLCRDEYSTRRRLRQIAGLPWNVTEHPKPATAEHLKSGHGT